MGNKGGILKMGTTQYDLQIKSIWKQVGRTGAPDLTMGLHPSKIIVR